MTGKAPATPGIYKTTWQLVDESRGWFGPTMWLDFSVVDCPTDAGVDQNLPAKDAAAEKGPSKDVNAQDGPKAAADGGPLFSYGRDQDSGCTCATKEHDRGGAVWLGVFAAGAISWIRRRRQSP